MKYLFLFTFLFCLTLTACNNSSTSQTPTVSNTSAAVQPQPKQINIIHSYTNYSIGTNAVCGVLKLNSDGTYLERIGRISELNDPLVIQNDDEIVSHYSIGSYSVSGDRIILSPKKGFNKGSNASGEIRLYNDKVTLIFVNGDNHREYKEDDNGALLNQ